MNTFPFFYRDNQLYCEGVALAELVAAVGTPVYVYSRAELLRRAEAYVMAVSPERALACYAVKANGNAALLRLLAEAGLGADVTSGGELYLALQAGFQPHKIIYSGVGKRPDEIEMALAAGIRALHVESAMEFDLIAALAADRQRMTAIGVRINPNIAAETHPYISTGQKTHKFGVDVDTAVRLLHQAQTHPWLKPVGLATHIGSQITAVSPFAESANYLVQLATELADQGIQLEYLDVGGGLGIAYGDWRSEIGDSTTQSSISNPSIFLRTGLQSPPISKWVTAVTTPVLEAGYQVVMEPGRSIVGPAGALLTQVLYTKSQGERLFAIVDAAMNDLLRPALYEAVHPVWRLTQSSEAAQTYEIVGPVCESGDWLAHGREIAPLSPGDGLSFLQAGAYGFAMASNYNGRLRPAELLVDGREYTLIRPRQTYENLL
ncbi:MAG: diaminopimelate decarboxylase [Chloroflexi bacterium]|nr:diaminopimelate decarboxylase [Chloroflexota bacterium]